MLFNLEKKSISLTLASPPSSVNEEFGLLEMCVSIQT